MLLHKPGLVARVAFGSKGRAGIGTFMLVLLAKHNTGHGEHRGKTTKDDGQDIFCHGSLLWLDGGLGIPPSDYGLPASYGHRFSGSDNI